MKPADRFSLRSLQRLGLAALMLLCSAFSINAWADPPGRVGRLGELNGQVWLYSPDGVEWVTADRNRPLTNGDRVATDTGARADIHIGSTTLRLDGGTELEVLRIDDDRIALQLHSGTMSARLRDAEAVREFELTTAEGRFVPQRPGRYRFDRIDDTSHLTVWSGQALYEGPGSALTVSSGQHAEFWLDNNAAQYSITEPVRDAFATWNGDRDRNDDRVASTRYVSPEMTGVEDLDRYGRWEQAPDYGAIWIPTAVAVGWAPYSAGHWAWVSPWGWTWVDDAPWGFAPFHYGRWAMYRDRWCWVPGTYVRRPVYAPALVAWVGGSNFSVSISVGGGPAPAVGWFPLAPREVYVPTYRVSPTYVQNVNITHVTNITNVTTIINNPQTVVANTNYQNRRFPHAVTVVPQTVLVNRQPVGPAAAQLRDQPAVRELATQPVQKVAVAAPPVNAPPMAAAVARRVQEQQREAQQAPAARAAAPGIARPPTAALAAVPQPPTRAGAAAAERAAAPGRGPQAGQPGERRGQAREEPQRPAPAAQAQGRMNAAPPPTAQVQAQAPPPTPAAAPPVTPATRPQPPVANAPAEAARPSAPPVERERAVPPPPRRGPPAAVALPPQAAPQAREQTAAPRPPVAVPPPPVAAPQPQRAQPQQQPQPAQPQAQQQQPQPQPQRQGPPEGRGRGGQDVPPAERGRGQNQAAARPAPPPQAAAVPPPQVAAVPQQAAVAPVARRPEAPASGNPRAEEQRRKAEEQRAREEQRRGRQQGD
jgi:hypothetical protein